MSDKSIREILCENCKINCKLLANNALVFGCFFNHNTNEDLQKAFESCASQYESEIEELKKWNDEFKNRLELSTKEIRKIEKEKTEFKKKVDELENVINSACDEDPYSFSSYCSGLIYNHDKEIEEIKKKLEK